MYLGHMREKLNLLVVYPSLWYHV